MHAFLLIYWQILIQLINTNKSIESSHKGWESFKWFCRSVPPFCSRPRVLLSYESCTKDRQQNRQQNNRLNKEGDSVTWVCYTVPLFCSCANCSMRIVHKNEDRIGKNTRRKMTSRYGFHQLVSNCRTTSFLSTLGLISREMERMPLTRKY